VPTSVLLAVLAAAGLLALAPALVRRYDATERLAAERATSTARVLSRRRRRRTVPGRVPVNPPRVGSPIGGTTRSAAVGAPARSPVRHRPAPRTGARGRTLRPGMVATRRRPASTEVYRRRRVLVGLVLLNLAELAGVVLVGSGFWIGFAVTATLLVVDLLYLRRTAVLADQRRRARVRHAAWIAAQQAAVRREHARRAEQRRDAARRTTHARYDAVRRSEEYVQRYGPRATGTEDRPEVH
jgi:hypothetical protein